MARMARSRFLPDNFTLALVATVALVIKQWAHPQPQGGQDARDSRAEVVAH